MDINLFVLNVKSPKNSFLKSRTCDFDQPFSELLECPPIEDILRKK
jgi:hypothetical protein